MADYLKTFQEGEDILASDTNANNQYLLSKLSDNAETLQTYLQAQIASIQANISSIQATLQSNIDKLQNDMNSLTENITTKLDVCYLPNFAKQTAISSGFVASSNGWLRWYPTAGDGNKNTYVYVNGAEVFWHSHYKYKNNYYCWVLIGKGDKVTITGSSNVYFYPCRTEG